jgi:tetratricopeptide (TPR) repeat protein
MSAIPTPHGSMLRDPWLLILALPPLLILLHSLGAALGEPAADDFDFLHHVVVERRLNPFDGGGSESFWRPVPHQAYYAVLGPLMLSHPRWVAALHLLGIAALGLMLYALCRDSLPRSQAAAAATFPLLAESSRSLLTWPSHFVELSFLGFSVLAMLLAARHRVVGAGVALGLALLCKEMAVVTAVLLPWVPREPRESQYPRESLRLLGIALLVVAAWMAVYAGVRSGAGLHPPGSITQDPRLMAADFPARAAWAVWNCIRASFSLSAGPSAWDRVAALGAGALVGTAAFVHARSRAARAVLRRHRRWVVWGVAWFLAGALALTVTYPTWAPYRALFASIGLGLALAVFVGSAHTWLLAGLVLLRLVLFLASPGPARNVTGLPEDAGAVVDFARITRVQRFMAEAREALQARFPRLPRGAMVGQHYLPQATQYALGGDRALQVWYRDTTLRWVRFETFRAHPEMPLVTIVQYQPAGDRQVALVDPGAMRAHLEGRALVGAQRWAEAIARFDRSDGLQHDRAALVLLASNAYQRAFCRGALGRLDEAEREARWAVATGQVDARARFVLGLIYFEQGRLDLAKAQLDSALIAAPGDPDALSLLAEVNRHRAMPRPP